MLRFHSPLIEPGVGFSGVHGFVRDASGSGFPSINVPGPTSTDALGINDSDLIVGYSLDASGYDRFLATPEPSRRPVRPVRAAMRASMWRNAPVPGGTIPYICRRIAQDALRAIAGTWVDSCLVGPARRTRAGLVLGRNETGNLRGVQFVRRDPHVGAWPAFDVEPLVGHSSGHHSPVVAFQDLMNVPWRIGQVQQRSAEAFGAAELPRAGYATRRRNVAEFIRSSPHFRTVMLAGDRESRTPGIGARVERFLCDVFRRLGRAPA
jgi:hypothetical protein